MWILYSISPDIATTIQKYQMSEGGKCSEDSEKSDTEVAPLPHQDGSTGITEGATATPTNRTEPVAEAVQLPAGSTEGEVLASGDDEYDLPSLH